MNRKHPFIFKDIFGRLWITGEGLRRYFGISAPIYRFYRYEPFI